MIRVIDTRYRSGNYVIADLIADTKSEVDNGESITGLPVGVDIDMGSTIITTDGHFALRNSSGEWVWQDDEGGTRTTNVSANTSPRTLNLNRNTISDNTNINEASEEDDVPSKPLVGEDEK